MKRLISCISLLQAVATVGAAAPAGPATPNAEQPNIRVAISPSDACVLTRQGFDVMCEMNPQVKKQLRVLAASKPMVSTLSCFRRGFPEALRQRVIETALHSKGKPAYEQVMILFKSNELTQQPVSALDSTRELLARYRRLVEGDKRNGDAITSTKSLGGGSPTPLIARKEGGT